MLNKVNHYIVDLFRRFQSDEDGLALTEYLILLGLLTAAVITAVLAFGGQLGTLWNGWATWINSLTGAPPPIT
ncbi:Flp family type IVb pilin [Roseovarius faecimaris]|uniref:Flp family type IVb pilin n=1 Tax=Roseovarius faecimaris TaxID=2494550 RepID=A0A6I6IX86_9RHOB|nr:Flp family type IVb pilin [Roseovarius faecimaris]QGY00202.1 Flp family type IVb pilin [Roseovarius faecimaris]